MQELQRAGLSLTRILRAATISNARALKIDSQVGTIEPGKIANLILLKESPLESISAYDSLSMVWIHGKARGRASQRM
jgi:imidazolonepropionase-like amidohydrolase